MILEEAQLPRRAVAENIGVLAAVQVHIGGTEIHARTVAQAFTVPGLRPPIAADLLGFKGDLDPVAVAVAIVGGEVPVDAALDAVAFGIDGDGLADLHAAVGGHLDVAVERQDLLVGMRVQADAGNQQHDEKARHGALLCWASASKNSPR